MHPPTDPREYDSPEYGATAPPRRSGITERTRSNALAMLIAALVLAAIVALIVLL